MKPAAIITLLLALALAANVNAQVTFSGTNVPLAKVSKAIEKQTDYSIYYVDSLVQKAKPVTISVRKMPVEDILRICLQGQALDYKIIHRTIIIKILKLEPKLPPDSSLVKNDSVIHVNGIVLNEKGKPMEGVMVTIYKSKIFTVTNRTGEFELYMPEYWVSLKNKIQVVEYIYSSLND